MQSPAIQAALNNLVETIRTSLMAEFLELLRNGKPAQPKLGRKARLLSAPAPIKKGGRRSSTAVEEVGKQIVAHLKKNPDSKVEHIATALGDYSSKDLALPIKKLLADKLIAKKGQRRGTTYRAKA